MADARVAVYVDFDNVVISRYEQVHGSHAWHQDNARDHAPGEDEVGARLTAARVDLGAIVDYASSYGTLALVRAYADWSLPANASYRRQLVDRSFDLTQMFPVSGSKNGADIRLAIDALSDLGQHPDLTHVVIVAGDSDYIPLAQRCKQLGRRVIGIGITGSTSRALVNACDEFRDYDSLPGVPRLPQSAPSAGTGSGTDADSDSGEDRNKKPAKKAAKKTAAKTAARKPKKASDQQPDQQPEGADPPAVEPSAPEREAVELLVRALRLASDKSDDEWVHAGGLKSQMQRMDPGFKEKTLGYKSFAEFVQAHPDAVDSRAAESGGLELRQRSR